MKPARKVPPHPPPPTPPPPPPPPPPANLQSLRRFKINGEIAFQGWIGSVKSMIVLSRYQTAEIRPSSWKLTKHTNLTLCSFPMSPYGAIVNGAPISPSLKSTRSRRMLNNNLFAIMKEATVGLATKLKLLEWTRFIWIQRSSWNFARNYRK